MGVIVTVHQAKSQLSKLLRAVESGEEVIIARRDKPVATLKRYAEERRRKPSEGAGGLVAPIRWKAEDGTRTDRELDKEIEEDFDTFEEDWDD